VKPQVVGCYGGLIRNYKKWGRQIAEYLKSRNYGVGLMKSGTENKSEQESLEMDRFSDCLFCLERIVWQYSTVPGQT